MPETASASPALLRYKDAQVYANCSLRTLKEAKASGDLAYVATSERSVRFTREDLDDWIARRRVPSRHENRRAS